MKTDYTRGVPLFEDDRGVIRANVHVIGQYRRIIINFGGEAVGSLAATREQALEVVKNLRECVRENFGEVAYNSVLMNIHISVVCDTEKHIVRVGLPGVTRALDLSPDVVLVLADRIEAAANKLFDS